MILERNHTGNQKFLNAFYCGNNTSNIDFVNLNLIQAQFLATYIHFGIADKTFAIYVKLLVYIDFFYSFILLKLSPR